MNHPSHSECQPGQPAGTFDSLGPPGLATAVPRAGVGDRLLAGVVAMLSWTLLAVAVALTPSESGVGTHEQLGMPPCSAEVLTGYPCPSCGMTTAFAWFVRGDLINALKAQVFGTALGSPLS